MARPVKSYRSLAVSIAALFAIAGRVLAQETPAGTWQTIDDASGKPRALVRISEVNGVLTGKIETLFYAAGEEENPRCTACGDGRKNQPVVGMTILSGLKREGNTMVWSGGEILDPNNGKTYRSTTTLIEGGRKLDVRGYIGAPLFGRTQSWVRAP